MNHKLVESYVKDQLRKQFGKRVFCENGIVYISSLMEVVFKHNYIVISGYKTRNALCLEYPEHEEALNLLPGIIAAQLIVEEVTLLYKEVI